MKLTIVQAVAYSATGRTDQVVHTLAEAAAEALALPMTYHSFTKPAERAEALRFSETDLVIIGTPTYAGRVPNKILPDFQKLQGGGALAVPVVTFGNRAYDNSLAELCAVLEAGGFHTVAAGAFAGRHAFTDQLAEGRPDWDDKREIQAFAKKTAAKVLALTELPAERIQVPGDPDAPYYEPKGIDGEPVKFLKAKPRTDLSKCCNCGVCARACPMGAINAAHVEEVPGTCIKCHACIRKCTRRAKFFDDPAFLSHVAMLEASFQERKENEIFL